MEWRKGLSEEEASKRLSVYGRNEVKVDEGRVWVRILFGQVKSPLVYVLLIASGVSLLLGDVVDAGVIFLARAAIAPLKSPGKTRALLT